MRKVVIYRGGPIEPAQVVVDLAGKYPIIDQVRILITFRGREFVDLPVVKGRKSSELIATCRVDGVVIGKGFYTGEPVAAIVSGTYVLCGKPLNILLADTELLYSKVLELFGLSNKSAIIEEIKKIIVEERRRYGRSKTAHLLDLYLRGEVSIQDLPSHIADLLAQQPDESRYSIVKQVLDAIYA